MKRSYRIRTTESIQQRARELRQEMTRAEKMLWEHLRDRRLAGYKFRRQQPLGTFITDFYCASAHLVVEVDGDVHIQITEQDENRTNLLEADGYRIIRFPNQQVENKLDDVLAEILNACQQ